MSEQENQFRIVARGKGFDVDAFLMTTALKIDWIERRGERNDAGVVSEFSGFAIDLGCGASLDLVDQQAIAVEFLSTNKAAMELIRSNPSVTTFYLGLREKVYPDSLGSIFDLSPSLMKIALEIGIQVTIWSCLHSRPWCDSETTG